MRIIDAVVIVLKENGSLTSKEVYEKIIEKELYTFGAKNPINVVNSKIRCHCEGLDFPSASPVKYFKITGKKENTICMKRLILINLTPKKAQRKSLIPKTIHCPKKRLIKHICFTKTA